MPDFDDFDDFFRLVCALPEKTEATEPLAGPPVSEDTYEEFASLFPTQPEKPTLTAITDREEARRQLLAKFPDADEGYLNEVLASSQHHLWAFLRDKADPRVDRLIQRFLRQRRITSRQRSEVGGNGVDWTYLRDTGLITRKVADGSGGYLYELDLEEFDSSRGSRDNLTSRDRTVVLATHGHRCNRCGSAKDLQADHRVGVAIAGGANGEVDQYQALCRPCNLNKRVACEKCGLRDVEMCRTCGWAFPENHTHIAGEKGVQVTFRLSASANVVDVRALLEKHGYLS